MLRGVGACFALASESPSARERFESWLAANYKVREDFRRIVTAAVPKKASLSAFAGFGGMGGEVLLGAAVLALLSGGVSLAWPKLASTGAPALIAWGAIAAVVGGIVRAGVRSKRSRDVTIALSIFIALWVLIYLGATAIPGAVTLFGRRGSFLSLLSFNLIGGALVYFASQSVWSKLRDALRRRFPRRLRFVPVDSTLELLGRFGKTAAPLEVRGVDAAASYVVLRDLLVKDSADTLDQWVSQAKRKPLPVEISLADPATTRYCWEAMVDPSLFNEEIKEERTALFRTLREPRVTKPSPEPVIRVLKIGSNDPGWARVEETTGFTYATDDDLIGELSPADIVHVTGVPIVLRDEVRLDVGAQTDAASTRTALVDPGFLRHLPVSCCIVQGRQSDSRVRTQTDREVAGRLRQFGANVFAAGVPVVLVLPPMPRFLAFRSLTTIAESLTDGKLASLDAWLRLVNELRQQVVHYGIADSDYPFDTAVEIAYDICVYLNDDVPDLRPGGWWRRLF
jgi:hypothetical protein